MIKSSDLLFASRAEHIPAGTSGLWFIRKFQYEQCEHINGGTVPQGTYTALFRATEATLHLDPPGEVVMEDTPIELKKHLDFMMRASRNVLVTGLGLGCVVRGLLAKDTVKRIVCIENSNDVLKLIMPHMPKDNRLSIIEAGAVEWTRTNKEKFDYAWHDLWANKEAGDPHLDVIHTQLINNCRKTVKYQGAWGYPRMAKRWLKKCRIKIVG